MKVVIEVLVFAIAPVAFCLLVGLVTSAAVVREIRKESVALRETFASEVLETVLQLQWVSTTGWTKMAEIAAAAASEGRHLASEPPLNEMK